MIEIYRVTKFKKRSWTSPRLCNLGALLFLMENTVNIFSHRWNLLTNMVDLSSCHVCSNRWSAEFSIKLLSSRSSAQSSALASRVKKTVEITNKHAIHILKSSTKTQAQRSGNLKVGSTALSTKNFRSMAGYGMWQRWCNSNGNNQPSFSLMFIRAWQFKLRNGSNTQMDLNVSIFKREYMKVIYFTHWHVQLKCRETMWRDCGFSPWDLPPSLPFAFTKIHRKWSDLAILAIEISSFYIWDEIAAIAGLSLAFLSTFGDALPSLSIFPWSTHHDIVPVANIFLTLSRQLAFNNPTPALRALLHALMFCYNTQRDTQASWDSNLTKAQHAVGLKHQCRCHVCPSMLPIHFPSLGKTWNKVDPTKGNSNIKNNLQGRSTRHGILIA